MHYGRIRRLAFAGLTVFLAFLTKPASSQTSTFDTRNWRFLNPTPMGTTFMDVDFVDNNTVMAIGVEGAIARSSDGGTNWNYGVFTFVNAAGIRVRPSFSDVHAVNAQVAYAVGNQGAMAKTTDGGATWSFVRTPLYAKARNINTVWFTNATTGYIGGQHNTPDSLPKLYVTRDGGATWDSMAPPAPVLSRIGYVNNPNVGWQMVPASAKDKEILRIKFVNDSIGYVSGTGLSTFLPIPNVNATTGLPTGTNTSTGGHHASLLWKISSGRLTDYSTTKERLGYGGPTMSPVTLSSRWGQPTIQAVTQSYRAMHIENDSTVLILSFNNNIVIRVHTGRADSSVNPGQPGRRDAGRYQVLNFPFPPLNAPPIPNPQTLNASNPYQIVKAANGKLMAAGNFGLMATSTDGGNTWSMETSLPQGQNFSNNGTWAIDISPGGKVLVMGSGGVMADSVAGGTWTSRYKTMPLAARHTKMEFVDCNTGIAAGGASVTVTTDGGRTWVDRARADFRNLNININGMTFPVANKAYFATSAGTVYRSPDLGVTMDPLYNDPNFQMNDVAAVGADSLWVVAYNTFSVPLANRGSAVFRSVDNGATWQRQGTFPVGSTAPNLSRIAFPSRQVGYIAGSRGFIYKTTDGGTTWTNVSPPGHANNTSATYVEIQALDENTVFAITNPFPNKIVYRTTNGGATWTNISSNIDALGTGNLVGLLMHDANNGYLSSGAQLLVTTNGGASWQQDISQSYSIFETLAFVPRRVPAGTALNRRRLLTAGISAPQPSAQFMEYGDTLAIRMSSTETLTAATCTSPTAGAVTINMTGGVGPFTYSIDGGAFQAANSFTGLTRGNKVVTVREATCGTTFQKTVVIPFTDNLTLTKMADTTVCSGAPFNLRSSVNGTGATFAWTPTTGLATPTAAITSASTTANTAYAVTATLNGCTRTATVNITTRPNPVVNAGPDVTILVGEETQLNGTYTMSGALSAFTWTPSNSLTNANTLSPTARPGSTTTYTLAVTEAVTNCTGTDDVRVIIIPYCVKVQNAFSPNGDGINDRWLLTTSDACTRNISVNVYNRYGQMVFSSRNYSNNWDGTSNGKPLPDGTYYYVVNYVLINGSKLDLRGDVTILR
jgi:gliding motility-associated-like protein